MLRVVRSQRGAGGGKGMGPGAGGEWLRPRRRWCSGRRGRRRWQWGRRRGSWRRRRGEGGGREAGGWAPPHTLVVSVGSLGGMGQGAGGGGGGDCGGGGGDDEGGGSGGDGGGGGGRRRPIVEQQSPPATAHDYDHNGRNPAAGLEVWIGEPACPAGPRPAACGGSFRYPPRGDPRTAWVHARAQVAVGMGWAGAGRAHADSGRSGWIWAMRATGRAAGPVRRCADGSCRLDPRLKLRRSYRKRSIMARCWSALACRRGGVGRGKCVPLFLVSTSNRLITVCQGQLRSLAACRLMAVVTSRTCHSAGRSGDAVLTWCSADR